MQVNIKLRVLSFLFRLVSKMIFMNKCSNERCLLRLSLIQIWWLWWVLLLLFCSCVFIASPGVLWQNRAKQRWWSPTKQFTSHDEALCPYRGRQWGAEMKPTKGRVWHSGLANHRAPPFLCYSLRSEMLDCSATAQTHKAAEKENSRGGFVMTSSTSDLLPPLKSKTNSTVQRWVIILVELCLFFLWLRL